MIWFQSPQFLRNSEEPQETWQWGEVVDERWLREDQHMMFQDLGLDVLILVDH